MKHLRSSLLLLILLTLTSVVRAAEPPAPATVILPPLKAVLIVGPIDGNEGAWTNREKANMELAAAELEANGVAVARFYAPNNDWESIKAAAAGAHFLLYRGHGVYLTEMPTPRVGGFALSGRTVVPDEIRSQLQLAPNAIVMLYGCFTAGTAGNDSGSIGSAEAQRRVAEYSAPFFDIGAGGYYANWFGDAFALFLRNLFAGQTLGQAYESFRDFNPATVERYVHPGHPAQAMWLDKDGDAVTNYNNAFVGRADQTLSTLFQLPAMELATTQLDVSRQVNTAAGSQAVMVGSSGGATFTWTASIVSPNSGWLLLTTASGSNGQQLLFTIDPRGLPPDTYSAAIRVQASGANIAKADQTLYVTLHVVDQLAEVYLPLVRR